MESHRTTEKEGYVIEAVQNRGYRLLDQTEGSLQPGGYPEQIKDEMGGTSFTVFDSIDSTNIRAKLEAEQGRESGLLVVSDMQSAGRGRRGRAGRAPQGQIFITP